MRKYLDTKELKEQISNVFKCLRNKENYILIFLDKIPEETFRHVNVPILLARYAGGGCV